MSREIRDLYNLDIARELTHEVSLANDDPRVDELCMRMIAIIQLCEQQALSIKSLAVRALQEPS